MNNENWNLRFYCQDSNNRDIFYVEVFRDSFLDFTAFNSSLSYNILQHSNIETLANQLIDEYSNIVRRDEIISSLFFAIQSISGISEYYFKPELLSKSGRHVPEYETVLDTLLKEKEFPDFAVFSPNINGFYFEYCLPFLQWKITNKESSGIDKKLCEKIISIDFALSKEYVEWYSTTLQYFHVVLIDNFLDYNCYIICQDLQIKLFFLTRRIKD
jgi:hypothetical protein